MIFRRVFFVLLCVAAATSRAVILFGTGDPAANTTAPTGSLLDSGWQYEGTWNAFLGTPIAPNAFITAGHVGGSVGGTFTFSGTNYVTTAMFDDPVTDLRIWTVDGTFPFYAPLYTASDETGKDLVVIGRGTQRGSAITLDGTAKGWAWGPGDGVERWGENRVDGVVNGGPGLGQLIYANFDAGPLSTGSNEAHLSGGDSGGAVFLFSGSQWALAGINYGVDGPFSAEMSGANGFLAALHDTTGYFISDGTSQVPASGPSAFYSTQISARQAWITSVIPEPGALSLLAMAAALGFAANRKLRR